MVQKLWYKCTSGISNYVTDTTQLHFLWQKHRPHTVRHTALSYVFISVQGIQYMTYKQTVHCTLFLFHSAPQNMPVTDTTHFFRTTQICKVTHLSLQNDPVPNYLLHMHTFAYKFTCKTNWNVCSISIFHYLMNIKIWIVKMSNIFSKLAYWGCTSSICVIKTAKEEREVYASKC